MKKTRLSIFALGTLMLLGANAFAQRVADLEADLLSPADNAVLTRGVGEEIKLNVTNHGPDDLLVGDSLFLGQEGGGTVAVVVLQDDLKNGETDEFTLFITFPEKDGSGNHIKDTLILEELCIGAADPSAIQNSQTGEAIPVTYEDNNLDNNYSCISNVTINPAEDSSDVSIAKVNTESVLSLYPNPAKTFVNFSVDNAGEATATIKDITGRTIATQFYGAVQANSNLEFNVSGLNAGMYIISVEVGDKTYTGKVTVQK